MRAAKILLQDAKQTFFGPSGRIYEKTGGYDQAKKDFEILKPRNVEDDSVHVVTQCISERMQNRRLRNGQTFTGARAFSRQKCFSVLLK